MVAQRPRIIFTNGAFDIFHEGHVALLCACRQLAVEHDAEVYVGINTDESLSRIKGGHRPIITLRSRIAVLEACRYVDRVIPFDEDDPTELIRAIRPLVLVKGNTAEPIEKIPGREYADLTIRLGILSPLSTTVIAKRAYNSVLLEPFMLLMKSVREWKESRK